MNSLINADIKKKYKKPTSEQLRAFGRYIQFQRIKRGYSSSKDLAKEIGVSKGAVDAYEQGRREMSMSTLLRLRIKLDLSLAEINRILNY